MKYIVPRVSTMFVDRLHVDGPPKLRLESKNIKETIQCPIYKSWTCHHHCLNSLNVTTSEQPARLPGGHRQLPCYSQTRRSKAGPPTYPGKPWNILVLTDITMATISISWDLSPITTVLYILYHIIIPSRSRSLESPAGVPVEGSKIITTMILEP